MALSARCPICGKPSEAAFRPFCSARCKRVDLSRWFNEVYRVPAVTPPDETDDGPGDPSNDPSTD